MRNKMFEVIEITWPETLPVTSASSSGHVAHSCDAIIHRIVNLRQIQNGNVALAFSFLFISKESVEKFD